MFPLLQSGDTILVEKVDSEKDLSIGGCLLYKSSLPKPTCHRLIKIEGRTLYLKGDYSDTMDAPVFFEDILGKVIAVKKKGKLIFLTTFIQRIKARVTARLSLFSLKFRFFMRLMRLVYYPPREITIRLLRNVAGCRQERID